MIDTKTDSTCNNMYLIDERICLKDSFEILNTNFVSLSSAYSNLLNYSNYYNKLYTIFTSNSSIWETGAVKANNSKQNYNSAYETVKNLSAVWVKEFAVIYPQIINIDVWNPNIQNYKTKIVREWLTDNFPPENFGLNQIIYVYVNLFKNELFTFKFSGSYDEKCTPPATQKTVSCSGAGLSLWRGCNHSSGKGKNKQHWCTNAYDSCGSSHNTVPPKSASCTSSGAKKLQLTTISNENNDTYTARCVLLKYIKNNDQNFWTNYE